MTEESNEHSDDYTDRLLGTRWKYHYCPEGVTVDCQDHTITKGADKPPRHHIRSPDLSHKQNELKKED